MSDQRLPLSRIFWIKITPLGHQIEAWGKNIRTYFERKAWPESFNDGAK